MHTLIVKHHAAVVAEIPLASAAVSLGRDPSNTVVIARPACSPFHATIKGEVINDLGSSTGTYVNGLRVKRATIRPGDRITVGDCVLEIRADVALRDISTAPSPSQPTGRTKTPISAPVLIALSGILDARSEDHLNQSLEIPLPPGAGVILDFSGVTSITGDGWRLLIKRLKTFTSPASITFTHMNPAADKGFRALGLGRFFSAL